ncbi:MAG: amino acid carrier protein [Verrucomicrobiales bacterium]|nr:amino acid carrier protein [Verrucomicrobiales bacterium]
MRISSVLVRSLYLSVILLASTCPSLYAAETKGGIDQQIDKILSPAADVAEKIVFWELPIGNDKAIPLVLIILGITALFLTTYFRFINFRALGTAVKTIRGKYTNPDAPGQITHFQALSAALSATVGLGNIAGVAVAIAIGGPGATFWMIIVGLCGMTTKFTECTLGVKFRKVDADGSTRGGAMYYLRDGLASKGEFLAILGKVLAVLFAIFCIAGAIGAGNMFQANQAHEQFSNSFGILNEGWQFGLIIAVLVGAVIIGGIVWIARVTSFLVPFMCIGYMLAAILILFVNLSEIPSSISLIFTEAFTGTAAAGGVIGAIIQGIKRGVFSNEAGVGSAPIAHSAVKTDKPASEGLVALLEPFIDTVVVCTMTALVIISSGMWNVKADTDKQISLLSAPESGSIVTTVDAGTKFNLSDETLTHKDDETGEEIIDWYKVKVFKKDSEGWVSANDIKLRSKDGIWLTSEAFATVIDWFPYILSIAVFLFAFSTMISWSYYAEQSVIYLFGKNKKIINSFKVIYCLFIVIGSAASLDSVIRLADSLFFCMVVPNLIGVYFLLPVVKSELSKYMEHVRKIDDSS